MNIKRSSWHYKLNKYTNSSMEWGKWNLCLYFWATVFKLAVISFAGLGAGVLIYLLVTDIPFLIMFSFLLLSAVLPTAAIYYLRKWTGKPILPIVSDEETSLIVDFLAAKKAKICPIIDFTD